MNKASTFPQNYDLASLEPLFPVIRQMEKEIIESNNFNQVFKRFGEQIFLIYPKDKDRGDFMSVVMHNYHNLKRKDDF